MLKKGRSIAIIASVRPGTHATFLGPSPHLFTSSAVCLQFQVQQGGGNAAVKYSGPLDVAKSLYREGGMRSIFKGTVATLLRGKNRLDV